MKKLLILMLSVILTASSGFGQISRKEARKQAREAKKEVRAKEEAKNNAQAKKMIDERHFVLEAIFLSDNTGERVSVASNLNFIVVDGEKGVFQFANGNSVGYNGLGGETVKGNVRNYKYSVDSKGVYNVDFQISSSLGTIFVHMTVTGSSLKAEATVQGNFSARLNYTGNLVPISQSRIYEGSSSN